MKRRLTLKWLVEALAMLALGLAFAGTAWSQQTSTTNVRKLEVISVDGNKLVVRDDKGTQEITVPPDFQFTVDGKKMAVSDLKPGMKGTATVTTTTSVVPVTVTEVREGEVLRASDMSMTVRTPDGVARRFPTADLSARGITLVKDGKPIMIGDLRKGDKLTATIISSGPPVVLTDKEVQMVLDEAKAEPAATTTTTTTTTAQAPAPAPAPAAPAPTAGAPTAYPAPASAPAPKPDEAAGLGPITWLVIALVIGAILFFVMRGKKA